MNPWEKYKADSPESGPWASYQAPAPEMPPAAPTTEQPTSFAAGVVQGFRDPLDALAQLLEQGAKSMGLDTEAVNKALGMPSAEQARVGATQGIAETFGGQPSTAGRMVGNIGVTLPFAWAAPTAATVRGAAALGAATGAGSGALQPVETGQDFWRTKAGQLLAGAGFGSVGGAAAGGLSRIVSPRLTPEIRTLMGEGVTPTPGQLLGPEASRIEQAATSIPLLGGAIKGSRTRAMEEFNTAALNRVLDTLPGTPVKLKPGAEGTFGREALEAVHGRVSDAYEALLPRLRGVADQQFSTEIGTIRAMANNLPPERATQLNSIIDDKLISRFTQGGRASGETLKQAEGELGRLSRTYRSSSDADQRIIGDALLETQATLRRMLERNNPAHRGELQGINSAYSELLRVERAGASVGAPGGVFTPAQLLNAVKGLDKSMHKRQFVQGRAPVQDLAEAGKEVLGSTLPTSGTAERAMVGAGLLGGAAYAEPMTLAAGGLAALAYTAPGQRALAALIARRPELAEPIGAMLQRLAAPAGAAAVPAFSPPFVPTP